MLQSDTGQPALNKFSPKKYIPQATKKYLTKSFPGKKLRFLENSEI
jgi:hypothetical protein